ncbi:MAG: FHA domain-containing protein [Planctomycetes bacterium]|nr:FHA domain-containing protein [Planctomycetota bacterium]
MQLRSRGTNELIDLADGMTIGRMADCAIQLQDGSISRHHASIEETGGMMFLVDNGSSNGCFRNGERTKRCEIRVGDLLTLGALAFDVIGEPKKVESVLAPAPAATSTPSSSASPPASTPPASAPSAPRQAPAASTQAAAESSAPSRSAEAAAERARLRHEIAGNHRSSGLGDLGQQPLGIKVLAGVLGLAVMYGVIVGIRYLAGSL